MNSTDRRIFLFLQGPLSPLFARIGAELRRRGHTVHRINLSFGDWLHWHGAGTFSYRGSVANWPGFVAAAMDRLGVTDLVLHGDRRIYHRGAAEAARERGIRVIATELGYLRPDWMTIERDATSTGSHFPEDPDHIRRIAASVPPFNPDRLYPSSFWMVAAPDVIYNLSNSFLWFLNPGFQRHTIYHPVIEYAAWIGRLMTEKRRMREIDARAGALIASQTPFYVFPMQLEGDFQIRDHSPFSGMAEAVATVLASFRAHAPAESHLVIKGHPLDSGLEHWPRTIARLAAEQGLGDRVHFYDGGRLDVLYAHTRGVVTVNSSAGVEAIQASLPVKTLTPAIYDIEGLTFHGPLDAFWTSGFRPDAELLEAFFRALAGTVQVRGTIYSDSGLDAAVAGMAERISTDTLNEPDAYVDPPPRLARARAMGIPL